METSPFPASRSREFPPALGYSGAALALWTFRRPILALAGLLIHLALSLVKPALLILGALKIADLLQASRETTSATTEPVYPGDDESMLVPARPATPAALTPTTAVGA